MAEKKIVKIAGKKNNRVFFGKGWLNKNEDGTEYTNFSFDEKFVVKILDTETNTEYEILPGSYFQGNPNAKRDGKKDADIRLSFKIGTTDDE